VEGAKRPRVDPEKRNKSEDGTGVAAYDRRYTSSFRPHALVAEGLIH
jgi:hypothetical protein